MYESLTKYLDEFTGTEFGTWIIDKKNDGTPEHPLEFPFVNQIGRASCRERV